MGCRVVEQSADKGLYSEPPSVGFVVQDQGFTSHALQLPGYGRVDIGTITEIVQESPKPKPLNPNP